MIKVYKELTKNGDYFFINARTKAIVSTHTEYEEVYFKQVELLGNDLLKLVYKDTFDGDIVIRDFGSKDYLLVFSINAHKENMNRGNIYAK